MLSTYAVRGGRIQNEYCEINVAEHCNLTCRACSHLSPLMAKRFVDPEAVFRDLSTLSKAYQARQVKLLGGEPLLHPGLLDVIHAVKASRVAGGGICVLTNGVLLPRMTPAFWREVDDVWLSSYPGKELSTEALEECRRLAAENGTRLKVTSYTKFRETFAGLGTADTDLVMRIYASCKAAHDWRCHTVAGGYFYRCGQSYFLSKVEGGLGQDEGRIDGLRITPEASFRDELAAYLSSPEPLAACSRCAGTVGRRFPHEQVTRRLWRQDQPMEELVDMARLARDERSQRWRRPVRALTETLGLRRP